MYVNAANMKGDALEQAVHFIEKAIIEYSPSLKNAEIQVEQKKVAVINDVKHEIDLYVRVDPGGQYESTFLFECKNWDHENVGKNEVIILSEKVRAFCAQRGFLVAKRFGEHAIAQAHLDPRIEVVTAKDFLGDNLPFPYPSITLKGPHQKKILIKLKKKNAVSGEERKLDLATIAAYEDGSPIDLKRDIEWFSGVLIGRAVTELNPVDLPEGRYPRHIKDAMPYDNLVVDGDEIELVEFDISFVYIKETVFPKVIARFDVEGRGKYLEVEHDHPDHGLLRIALAATENDDDV